VPCEQLMNAYRKSPFKLICFSHILVDGTEEYNNEIHWGLDEFEEICRASSEISEKQYQNTNPPVVTKMAMYLQGENSNLRIVLSGQEIINSVDVFIRCLSVDQISDSELKKALEHD